MGRYLTLFVIHLRDVVSLNVEGQIEIYMDLRGEVLDLSPMSKEAG